MKLVIVLAMLVLAGRADAQPWQAIGKPLPDANLADGTLVVKVIEGDLAKPIAGARVKVDVGGTPREATTDVNGRATFASLAAGASLSIFVPGGAGVSSDAMTMPATGGLRVLLSTIPFQAPTPPSQRTLSGRAIPEPTLPAGAVAVDLAIDQDTAAPPPTQITLVGYSDDKTSVVTATTDAGGRARFAKLDTSGRTAYYALALIARGTVVDRLASRPIIPEPTGGARVRLVGDVRAATAPVDDVLDPSKPAPPRGKVQVEVGGLTSSPARFQVVDAATGKALASSSGVGSSTMVVAAAAGRVLYADVETNGATFRSLPFLVAADRGAAVGVAVIPRIMPSYESSAVVDDERLDVHMHVAVQNNDWRPYAAKLVVPLPRGAKDALVPPDDPVKLTPAGIELVRPVPPGGLELFATFHLDGTKGVVAWSQALPYGAFRSSVSIEKVAGLAVDIEADSSKRDAKDGVFNAYILVETVTPRSNAIALTVHLPPAPPDAALQHACRGLSPDRKTARLGKTAPEIALGDVKRAGKKLALTSLRGKTVLVNFMASWDQLSGDETPKLVALAKQVPGLAVVRVASDRDASGLVEKADAALFPVLLDPPAKPDDNIGAVTRAWGTTLLPESYLVDKKGVVRFYLGNARDWSSPDAVGCLKALDAER